MPKTAKNDLIKYEGWAIRDWSVQHELLTLNLNRVFFDASKKVDQGIYSRASCRFVRYSRVKFSKFLANKKAVIQELRVSPPTKGLTTYRFEFEDDSFIEIIARDCTTTEW